MGDSGSYRLLILSQVILSLQLPFAVVPLIRFTSSREKMGPFANRPWVKALAWAIASIIIALNVLLVYQEIVAWTEAAGSLGWLVLVLTIPIAGSLAALLAWMTFRRETDGQERSEAVSAESVAAEAVATGRRYERVGVALEARAGDSRMLAQAIALAGVHGAELVLLHVVEGVGGQWYGQQTGDTEAREDEVYLRDLSARLERDLAGGPVAAVRHVLGYGDVARELVRLTEEAKLDVLVVGGHGHRGLGDVLHGQTIPGVRHGLRIPVFAAGKGDGS